MEDPTDTEDSIVETRQELMVSPTEHDLRTAHFLKPSAPPTTSIEEAPPPSFFNSATKTSKLRKITLEVSFHGWLFPQDNWKNWVERLCSKHKQTWEKAGIYDAIMGSTYKINKYPDLVLELAKKWSPQTNTFVFDFAETTITLEDVMLCGGYSVLGCPVFDPPETSLGVSEREETENKEKKLNEGRSLVTKTKDKKACQNAWMRHFMEDQNDSTGVEHEAFLSLWLSRFVFPAPSRTTVTKHIFRLAIRLARGTRIALAPAVLACIYRDLSYLKEKMVALSGSKDSVEEVVVWAPFQLVLVWIWERFMLLQPERNVVEVGEPRVAQWHKLKKLESEDIETSAFDSSGEFFAWRPHADAVESCCVLPKFYRENEEWLVAGEGLDEELESIVRCLRASELVGIDQFGHFVEQYLPHRVARQFGLDQDVPGSVVRYNQSHDVAWKRYNKPINRVKLYIPSRFFSSGVSARYFEWWSRPKPSGQDGVEPESVGLLKRRREESSSSNVEVGDSHPEDKLALKKTSGSVKTKKPGNGNPSSGVKRKKHLMEPVGKRDVKENKMKKLTEEDNASCRRHKKVNAGGFDPEDKLTLTELFRSQDVSESVDGKFLENGSSSIVGKEDWTEPMVEKASVQDKRKRLQEENELSSPPGFSQKYNKKLRVRGSDPEETSTLIQMFGSSYIDGIVNAEPLAMMQPFEKEVATENKREKSKEEHDASCSRGFLRKCDKVEVGDSDPEDKLTLTRMFTSQGMNGCVNGSHLPVVEPVKEEATIEESKKSEEQRLNDNEAESREDCEFDLDELDTLEARITKLENSIAKIKAARRGKKMVLVTKKIKEEPIYID